MLGAKFFRNRISAGRVALCCNTLPWPAAIRRLGGATTARAKELSGSGRPVCAPPAVAIKRAVPVSPVDPDEQGKNQGNQQDQHDKTLPVCICSDP